MSISPSGGSGNETTLADRYISYLKYDSARSSLTITAYVMDLDAFGDFLGRRAGKAPQSQNAFFANFDLIKDATREDIREWIASKAALGIKSVTLRRALQSLRSFYKYLRIMEIRNDDPSREVDFPKAPEQLPNFVATPDMESIIAQIRSNCEESAGDPARFKEYLNHMRDLVVFQLLYTTGIRQSELTGIDDNDINFETGEIRVFGKRMKERILPLHHSVMDDIRAWQRVRDTRWPLESRRQDYSRPLFLSTHGRISKAKLYIVVSGYLKGTNARQKGAHTLRHTFATSMLNGGADINDVKEFLGHESLATTQKYTHVTFSDMKEAYDHAHPRSKSEEADEKNRPNKQI